MALKIMDEHERVPKSEYATEALEYAIKMGAIISCNSYGIHCYKYNVQPDGHFCDKYFNDFRNLLQGAPEHVFVGAAGNIGNCNDDVPSLPCNVKAPNVLCVAASTEQNEIWPATNYGRDTVHVFAPGENIESLSVKPREQAVGIDHAYTNGNGTSFAAPYVAGLAGLILSMNKELTGERVKKYIEDNVQKFDQYDDYVTTGGLIDVGKTLTDVGADLGICLSFHINSKKYVKYYNMNESIYAIFFPVMSLFLFFQVLAMVDVLELVKLRAQIILIHTQITPIKLGL